MLTPPDDKHSIAAKREMYEALITPRPSPRDIERATKLFAAFGIHVGILGSVHESEGIEMVAQALAQREAEVRAEFAAFADENGKPRKVLGKLPVTADEAFVGDNAILWLPPGKNKGDAPRQRTNKCAHFGKMFSSRDAALAARKEGE
jgi:hypothetical protein